MSSVNFGSFYGYRPIVIDLVSDEEISDTESMAVELASDETSSSAGMQPIPAEEFGHEPLTNRCDINPESILEAETTSLTSPLTRNALQAYKQGKRSRSSPAVSEERPKKRARMAEAPTAALPPPQVQLPPLSLITLVREESSSLQHDLLDLESILKALKQYKESSQENGAYIHQAKELLLDLANKLHQK